MKILDEITIEVYFELIESHPKGKCNYVENLGSVLIRKCNKLAKVARAKVKVE